MHTCPKCWQACDCDGEDTWYDEEPTDCSHNCQPYEGDDYEDDDEE
jgi:hypothetical protein